MTDRKLVGLVHNPLVPKAKTLLGAIVERLGLRGGSWVASAADLSVGEETLRMTSAVITAGGDGTILRVARVAAPHRIPILGINLGRVGFMAELSVDEAMDRIPDYLEGDPRVEERMMLEASVVSAAGERRISDLHALNDVVVSRGAVPMLLDIGVVVDGVRLTTYRADGVIVSTATGSTGYALSAGGPMIYPEAGITLVQPLAAHMSIQAGIIVPGDSTIELRNAGRSEAVLSVDGFVDAELGPAEVVVVERSPHLARFLRADPAPAFYSTVTRRLGVRGLTTPPGEDD